ncbi:MAG: dihydroorotate dehydrogenase-like protein [Luteolibacter sp.]
MNLSTTYLGLSLRTPLVPSAAQPLTEDVANIKRLEDAGASAVVMHSLFEEQLAAERDSLFDSFETTSDSFAEALTFFPEPDDFQVGPESYLKHIAKAKQSVGIPVIASLNGASPGGWVRYAREIERAGADALELNIYWIPTDPNLSSLEIEDTYIQILRSVKEQVSIPVGVKLSPFFTNFSSMAKRLEDAGADGLTLFNRFYQPDINLEELEVEPNLLLSTPMAMRLPLRWIAILRGELKLSLAATSGIHRASDALKCLMAGADVTMMCSAILRKGPKHIASVEQDIREWLEKHEYESIEQLKGSMSQRNCPDPGAFERAQYMRAVSFYQI